MVPAVPPSTAIAPALALRRLIFGHRITQIVGIAAQLRLADVLGTTAQRAVDLAPQLHVDAAALYRLLRALASIGVLELQPDDRFSLTPVGACLRSDAPDSQRAWALMEHAAFFQHAWSALPTALQIGDPAAIHAWNMPFYDYMASHADVAALFHQSMTEAAQLAAAAIVAAYPIPTGARIVDVGGGYGSLLTRLLRAHPTAQGVLFDRPVIVADAQKHLRAAEVADRCTVVGGDFFDSVPAGGDVYLLSRILMDHDDAHCIRLLRSIVRAMPAHGRLLVIQQVLPDGTDTMGLFDGSMSDLNMLVMLPGRERTAVEYHQLLNAAGLAVTATHETRALMTIIEAMRKGTQPEDGP